MIKDLQAVKSILDENNAVFMNYSVVDYSGQEDIVRGWEIPFGTKKNVLESCKEFLRTYGSVLNGKESFTIKNPIIDREEWDGTFQHFVGGWQRYNGKLYLTQLLRRNYYKDVAFHTTEISGEKTVTTRQQLGVTSESLEATTAVAGAIVKQDKQYDRQNGAFNVTTEKDTGAAQTTTTYEESPSESATIEEKTVQETALTAPTSEKGYIKRVINAASRYYQRWTTRNESRQPKDQTATSTFDSGMESSTTASHTENPDTPTAAASSAGNIKEVTARPTEAGNLATQETTKTAKQVSVSSYVSKYGEDETEYRTEEYHSLTPPAITDETADGIETVVLSHDYDDYLTHNYKVARIDHANKFPWTGEITSVIYGDYEYSTAQTYSTSLGRYWNSATYVYQRKTTSTAQYFKTAAEAYAYIGGTFLTNNSGSYVQHRKKFQWLGVKIVHTKSLITTYEYLEPTS